MLGVECLEDFLFVFLLVCFLGFVWIFLFFNGYLMGTGLVYVAKFFIDFCKILFIFHSV